MSSMIMLNRNDLEMMNRALEMFDRLPLVTGDHARRRLLRYLGDDEFYMAVFTPQGGPDFTRDDVMAKLMQLYDSASKRAAVRTMARALGEYGTVEMGRPAACFFVTLVNLGMANIDEKATDLGRQKDHGEIYQGEYDRKMQNLDIYQSDLKVLLKLARRIVKSKAKMMSERTAMPKEMCISALYTVPGPNYIDTYKLGFYLKTLLGNLYGFVNYSSDAFLFDFNDIMWGEFFANVFGKRYLPDIASLLLLEEETTSDRYENAACVDSCKQAMISWALQTLNKAPESVRDQMIELYLKRLNHMLANHNLDVRIDLRMLDNFKFDKLVSTVAKYRDRFDELMAAMSGNVSPKPESSPV